ncbi:MAG: caspase family protein [Xanthomonadales bacterium]|nr:caspase family protein [Xanthomonadales bacterium]
MDRVDDRRFCVQACAMRAAARGSHSRRWIGAVAACALVVIGGWPAAEPAYAAVRNAEDLMIVDCLLPGQVRRLGRQAQFMSARRPIRTTQADCEIRGGEYVAFDRANYQTALRVWMDQALAGSAEAQNNVGEIFQKGLGTEPDYAMAAQWYEKASVQGYKRARINLGYLYEQGLGVARDLPKALNLYREASGIDDELLFASAVEVQMKAKEAEISSLKESVESERETSAALRARVQELQKNLDTRQRALRSSERELESTRVKLKQAQDAVGVDMSGLDARRSELAKMQSDMDRRNADLRAQQKESERRAAEAEKRMAELKAQEAQLRSQPGSGNEQALKQIALQTAELSTALADAQKRVDGMRGQLANNQSLLAEQRAQFEAEIARLQAKSEGRQQEDWALLKLLENQLADKQSQVQQQRQQIASLQQQIGLGGRDSMIASVTPTLELIDPPLTVTRGAPAAMLMSPPGRRPLVGRVKAPTGIASLTINGQRVELNASGVFRTEIDVAAAGTPVEIAATDPAGAVASLDFMMIPQADAGSGVTTVAASKSQRQLPRGARLGKFHALVIGNDSYQAAGYQQLSSAGNDASAVARVLREDYGYDTRLLLNVGRLEMLTALNELREELGPDDNLMIYYAGHGEIDAGGQGYWVPVDARKGSSDTWVSNQAISAILDTMNARHVMVVADSCYSGAMTRSSVPTFNTGVMPQDKWAKWVSDVSEGRSRTALTSGGVQPVPDSGGGQHSYFAGAFLRVLQSNNGLLEGQRLYREVSASLALASVNAPITQTPEYAPIQFAGHESGDFFLVPKKAG